jgi:hypothetical protein
MAARGLYKAKADTVELDNTNNPALADPFALSQCVRHRATAKLKPRLGPI